MKSKMAFACTECGYTASKWFGRCPSCQAWNSAEEQLFEVQTQKKPSVARPSVESSAVPLAALENPEYIRSCSGIGELDRVLGGGLVSGSVVLLAGEPGIGKSTLLLQLCDAFVDKHMLYVSGEESQGQLKLRAKRLGVKGAGLYVQTETNIERITGEIERLSPDAVIVDSIQTMYYPESASAPGSVTQVRECAFRLISIAKSRGISIILVGHVNKEGGIAGPKVLEHMVDSVLYFEGEQQHAYRIIRAAKNRFGSTNEIGVFEMTGSGLIEVPNPSEALLAGRPKNVSGNCAVCMMEGSRPIIAEIQALATSTVFSAPRRTSSGIDYNRLYLLLAVLEKRLGLKFSASDVYLNVIGGLRIDEPAADLPAALALISSIRDKVLPEGMIAAGEIGLAGECRAVSGISQRVSEAERLGFTQMLIPERNYDKTRFAGSKIKLCPVKSIFDAVSLI